MRTGMATDSCMSSDMRYRAEMETASAVMHDVLRGKMQAPRGLRWRDNGGPVFGKPRVDGPPGRLFERDQLADTLRVSRDVCPRCGSRSDVCGHGVGGRLVCL